MEEQWQKTIEMSGHEDEAARVEQERRLAKARELAAQMRYAEELKVHQLAGLESYDQQLSCCLTAFQPHLHMLFRS